MKRCTLCGDQKPTVEFYRSNISPDGLRPRCKSCMGAASRAYSKTEAGRLIAEKIGKSSSHKKAVAKYANSEKGKAAHKIKYQNALKSGRLYAYACVQRALKERKIFRKNVCTVCFKDAKTHFHHHNGYGPNHRLDVVEICTDCHGREHRHHLSA